MKRFWAMRSAVVTGGQGFIGRHLVNALRQRGIKVTTLGRRPSVDTGRVEEASWGTPALDRVFQNVAPDCIFHLAGRARGTPAELTYEIWACCRAFCSPSGGPPCSRDWL